MNIYPLLLKVEKQFWQAKIKKIQTQTICIKIYRRGLLYALHRLGCNPYHSACHLANDHVHCLRCISIP